MWQCNLWSRCLNWRFLLLGLHDYLPFFLIKAYTDAFLLHFLVLSFHLHHCMGFTFRTLSLYRCLVKLCFLLTKYCFFPDFGQYITAEGVNILTSTHYKFPLFFIATLSFHTTSFHVLTSWTRWHFTQISVLLPTPDMPFLKHIAVRF